MTMTPERLAELDAVMARATEGPWQRKSGFEKLTIIGNIDGEIVESQTKYTYEMVCEVYDDNGVIVAGRNVTAIVALHNAYPDLRATIDTQAATIAGLRERMLSDAAVDAGARAHMNERRRLNGVEPISDEDWHAITDDSGLRSCMDMPFRAAIVAALNAAGAA